MKITGIGQGYMVKTKYPCLSFGTDSIASYTTFLPKKKVMTPKVLRRVFLSYHFIMGPEYKGQKLSHMMITWYLDSSKRG